MLANPKETMELLQMIDTFVEELKKNSMTIGEYLSDSANKNNMH